MDPDTPVPTPRAIFLWDHNLKGSMWTVGEAAETAATAAYFFAETKHRGWRFLYALAVCDAAVAQARACGEEELATTWETTWLAILRAAWEAWKMEEGPEASLAEVSRGALQ